jgi:hypothetical protein
LRTVRDDDNYVLLATQVDIVSRLGNAVCNCEVTVPGDRYIHEEVDIRRNIPRPHAELAQSRDKVVPATEGTSFAVAHEVDLATAVACQRIVAAHRILDHRHQRLRQVVINDASFGKIYSASQLHGVCGIVADRSIGGVVNKGVDGLAAFQIDDPQHGAFVEPLMPIGSRGQNFIADDLTGHDGLPSIVRSCRLHPCSLSPAH